MKRILLFALVAIAMSACNLTKESKAEALVKESLKKMLYKPNTYEPIETKVDSAFAPYDDPAFFEELDKLEKLDIEYDELKDKIKDAKSDMSSWVNSSSAFGRNEYQEAKANYDEANTQMAKLMPKGRKQYNKVMSMLQAKPKFIGYYALHNYRADNNAGNTVIGHTVFFLDKDCKEVIYYMELDDYNRKQELIEKYIEQIEDKN